ncbi:MULTISPECIES: MurR/RpiR family transcriptional regulator [Ralstonia]|jgi:RpiR family carbohydrate utilization transcriptional regulator|uniref:HTH-type transcriptional regulator HexR n=6 Tax=Pseudomonadota TaxID=1224 RepID=A0AAD2EZU6_9RALS|nr:MULTISPECIES: MurR/RpiR family transcriptional regulator [Ralstonia]MEA3267794.1 MurR/RpiR family transcriptional regulator [Pseudomonadota bacterium]ENZ76737.1 transcriptional regulator, RpiR family [Ralstonia pickettii OR214]MBB0022336.1 MurR/RpiR family transcriptional regulator [Ralstonia pickettii]MBB0032964.1 MurR/RpiR family transcriptional regulator [Ralstonia pickettii]MBB0095565.1 MurR/RpiR family transcriptional regulator [Ralstonia pickettii]
MSAQQATSPATPDTPTDLRERIRAARPSLSPAERQVADWVLRQPGTVLSLPVAAIAREAGVSQPTVIRFCRSMGCHGLSDFKLRLAQGNVARDTAPARVAPPSGMRVLQNAIDSLTTLQGRFDPHTLDAAVALVDSAHRIDLYGFGSSGVVALDAQTKFFRYGIPANAYSDPYLVSMSLNVLQAGDVVIAISKSGALPELQTAVERVRELGVRVIAVTTPGSPLAALADVVLPAGVDDAVADRSMVARLLHLALLDALVLEVALRKGSALQHADQPE